MFFQFIFESFEMFSQVFFSAELIFRRSNRNVRCESAPEILILCPLVPVRNASSNLAIFTSAAVIYCIVVLWYVTTSPDIGLRCLPDNNVDSRGVEVRVEPQGGGIGSQPKAGDVIVELRGRPIRSFVDFAWAHTEIRNAPIDPGGFLEPKEEFESRLSRLQSFSDRVYG